MTARKPPPVDLIDALLTDYKKPEDLIGEEGLLKQLIKAFVERALNAEMTDQKWGLSCQLGPLSEWYTEGCRSTKKDI